MWTQITSFLRLHRHVWKLKKIHNFKHKLLAGWGDLWSAERASGWRRSVFRSHISLPLDWWSPESEEDCWWTRVVCEGRGGGQQYMVCSTGKQIIITFNFYLSQAWTYICDHFCCLFFGIKTSHKLDRVDKSHDRSVIIILTFYFTFYG